VDEHKWILVVAGVAPALIAMVVVDYLDRKRPEPRSLRIKVALFGALSVGPILVVDAFVLHTFKDTIHASYTYNGALFQSFVVAAGVEEALKISVIYWVVWRRPEFDERMDGIVYGGRAGLGFALVENVMYMLKSVSLEGALQTGILRAVLAVPGHALWSAMIGYAAARARFDLKGFSAFAAVAGGYLLAVALHGGYDYAIFAQAPMRLENQPYANYVLAAPIATILVSFLIVRWMAKTALRHDDAAALKAHGLVPPTSA
jgi:RsiW-degrading membrane proteinase PrsW (M82 family)